MQLNILDTDRLKSVGESILVVELLYQTKTKELTIHSKGYICTIKEPNYQYDNGLIRRSLMVETNNKFVPINEFKKEPNTYVADITLWDRFNSDEYHDCILQHRIAP